MQTQSPELEIKLIFEKKIFNNSNAPGEPVI